MNLVDARDVARSDLDALDETVASFEPGSPLAAALGEVSTAVRAGTDVVMGSADVHVTPAQGAQLLGISRTHLYKLLDAGDISYVRVGRDRRVPVANLLAFATQRDAASKALAERFASRDSLRRAVLDSMTDD